MKFLYDFRKETNTTEDLGVFTVEDVFFDPKDTTGIVTLVSTEGSVLKFELDGDCCSSSFFDEQAIIDFKTLFGHTINTVENVFIGIDESNTTGKTDISCLKITTDKESFSFMWRNESNGYYSGSIAFFLNGLKFNDWTGTFKGIYE
jgi:hypothetical protein